MAKGKKKKVGNMELLELPERKPKKVKEPVADATMKYIVWFSTALKRFKGLRPHHLSAIQVYFTNSLGLSLKEDPTEYDEGMIKFGFGRK